MEVSVNWSEGYLMRHNIGASRGERVGFVLAACFVFGTAQAQPFGLSFQGVESGHADVTNVECSTMGNVLVALEASDATEEFHFSFSADNYGLMFVHAPKLNCSRMANSQGISWRHEEERWVLNLDHVQFQCQQYTGSGLPQVAAISLNGQLDCTHVIGTR